VRNVKEKALPCRHNEDKQGNSVEDAYFLVTFGVFKVWNTNSSVFLDVTMKWNEMFIDHSVDPYMGRSPIGCRARQNT
jgi:hypothetical protein